MKRNQSSKKIEEDLCFALYAEILMEKGNPECGMQNNKCGRCGGSTLELDKYDILGNIIETERKCIMCGHEQKTEEEVDMGEEKTEEEKEKKRDYQRKWYKKNKEWARRKVGKEAISHGTEQKEEQVADCKYHADVPAVVDKNGRTLGLCRECLVERARKSQAARFGKSKKKRPERALPARVSLTPPLSRKGRGNNVEEHDGKIFIPTAQLVQPAAELRFELIYKLADARVLSTTGYRS
jgi:hypothetical protein